MPIFPGKKKVITEETIPIYDIDPTTCREKFKGDVDEHGTCLVRIRTDTDNPDRAELLRLVYYARQKMEKST